MLVKLLQVHRYREDGSQMEPEDIANLTWRQIEESIRRLDRFCYPFVMLYCAENAEEDDLPDFDVIGGESMYAFECRVDCTEYSYVDPSQGEEEMWVWVSDQGAAFPERNICYDIDIVLQATRYYCDHGTPDPKLNWQERLIPV